MPSLTIPELAARIFEGTPDAVLFADREGIIRFWNEGARRIFGFAAEDAVGVSLDLIIPEALRARHWNGYRQVMETGTSHYSTELLSVPALHKDGRQLSCEFSIVMIRDATNRILGFASIMRDVTTRWEKEKALRKKLADLEAKKV